MSITPLDYPPEWSLMVEDGLVVPQYGYLALNTRRDQLDQSYKHDGCIIFAKTKEYRAVGTFYLLNPLGFIVEPEEAVDIDRPIDLQWAEFLAAQKGLSSLLTASG